MTLRGTWRPGDRFLVRYKDAALLVVEKKAGVLSQATESGKGEDMLHLLRDFIGAKGRSPGVLPVHRLDRVVSGLLVYARRADVQADLIEQFARHEVERRYVAAVHGVLEEDEGTFQSRLYVRDPSLRVYSIDDEDDAPGSREAITHWRVLERYHGADATLVEVELETGLRNQIRVHFAEAGHPLLGERKYEHAGDPEHDGEGRRQGHERIFLHAARLGFVHPLTNEELRFEARLPPDLHRWREALRRARPSRHPREEAPRPEGQVSERTAPERTTPERATPERTTLERSTPEQSPGPAPRSGAPRRKKAHRGQHGQRRRKKR